MGIFVILVTIATAAINFNVACETAGGDPKACYKAYDVEKSTSDYAALN